MTLDLVTEPSEEPVSLADLKEHLRINSASFAGDVDLQISISPGSHAVASSLLGSAVTVTTYSKLVILESGTVGTGGTVDVKIQESEDASSFSDWAGSVFTQVTPSNDESVQEIEYTGNRAYIRASATIAGSAASFAVSVIRDNMTTSEDDYLTDLIKVSRRYLEKYAEKAFVSQTWDVYWDDWPGDPWRIPVPPLQSVTHITYEDSDGDVATVATTVYNVDAKSRPGRVALKYGQTWPTVSSLQTVNAIKARIVAGYGTAGTVPAEYKHAIMLLAGHLYENREQSAEKALAEIPLGVDDLLGIDRMVSFV